MAVTRETFVAVFPEFKDTVKYPDAAVTFWLTQAGTHLPRSIPPAQVDLATMLYVAHNLTLGVLGGVNGGSGSYAPVASKAVGSVSKSYDTGAVTSQGAGIWNGTAYGQRLLALLRSFATGGLYRPSARAAAIAAGTGYPFFR